MILFLSFFLFTKPDGRLEEVAFEKKKIQFCTNNFQSQKICDSRHVGLNYSQSVSRFRAMKIQPQVSSELGNICIGERVVLRVRRNAVRLFSFRERRNDR